ncbi:MAG: hypoxanthine-guanine phosphoribosyltransferase [Gammaproteobacteria bacterium]
MTTIEEIDRVKESAELLYDRANVDAALDAMAAQINRQLADRNPVFLCVMNGGLFVGGQLLPRLTMALNVDAVNASRYRNHTSGSDIEWRVKPYTPLKERTVLIVDDILDEGVTLEAIYRYCSEQGAEKVYSAVLVDKMIDRVKPVRADFVGLRVENRYVFGCGMDYKGYLRNLPGIYACR